MKSLLALTLCFVMALTACSPAWLTTVNTILTVAGPALVNILQIVAVAGGKPFDATLAAKINNDVAALKQLVKDFSSASAAAKPGACTQLLAGLAVYSQDITTIMATAQVSDPATQQKILLLSGLVVGTVEAIAAVIPGCSMSAQKGVSQPFNVNGFIADYNTELVRKTGNPAVDAVTPGMKLHK